MKFTLLLTTLPLGLLLPAAAQEAAPAEAPAHGEPGHVHAEGEADRDHDHPLHGEDGHVHAEGDEHDHEHEHAHGHEGPHGGILEHIGDGLVEVALVDGKLVLRLFSHDLKALPTGGWSARGSAGERGAGLVRLSFGLADGVFTGTEALPASEDLPIRLVIEDAAGTAHRLQVHLHGTELVPADHDHADHDHHPGDAENPAHGEGGHVHAQGEADHPAGHDHAH